jgi:hypothetical protein
MISGSTETGGAGWEPWAYDELTGILVEIRQEPVGDGHTKIMIRRTYLPRNELLNLNAERRAQNAGTGWKDGAVAASIPLNLYYEKIAPARKQGDTEYVKRLLNDSDYKYLRTKEGKI